MHALEYVYEAFKTAGPDIRYSYPSQWGWRRFPSYADLMVESDLEGRNHSYIADEEQFQLIKNLETENRIVPIVGNFAGDQALPEVGKEVFSLMNAKHRFLVGLGQDEVGYILPKADFDPKKYEESMSLGPETAPTLLDALNHLLKGF